MPFHEEFTCCIPGCGGLTCLTPEQEKKLRRTHEWFQCPFGHNQHFPGKTADEKRIEALECEVRGWRRTYDDRTALAYDVLGWHRDCPLGCGWRSRKSVKQFWSYSIDGFMRRVRADVRDHLHEAHGAELPPDPAEVERDEVAA